MFSLGYLLFTKKFCAIWWETLGWQCNNNVLPIEVDTITNGNSNQLDRRGKGVKMNIREKIF